MGPAMLSRGGRPGVAGTRTWRGCPRFWRARPGGRPRGGARCAAGAGGGGREVVLRAVDLSPGAFRPFGQARDGPGALLLCTCAFP